MLAVDASGVGHLLPALERATHAAPGRGGAWFVTIFVLGALLGAPLLARAAERHGRICVLRRALWLFALASVIVGLSSSFPLSLAARFAQGFGGSAIMPLAAAHLHATAPPGEKGRNVSLLSLWYAAGFLAGIALVSLFLLLSFRSAYLFNAALAGAVAAMMRSVTDSTSTASGDGPTALRTMAWFIALTLGAVAVSHATSSQAELEVMVPAYRLAIVGSRLAAIPAVLLFVWWDGRSARSLLPRDSFRSRGGIASACLALVAGLGQASIVVMPTCAMEMLGVSAAASGPLLLPVLVGGALATVLATARLDRWGALPFLATGMALVAAGNIMTAKLGEHLVAFEAGALFLGTGVSLLSSGALRHLAASYGAPDEANARQAAISLLTNVGLMSGGAIWGATLAGTHGVAATGAGLMVLTWTMVPLWGGLLLLLARNQEGSHATAIEDHA